MTTIAHRSQEMADFIEENRDAITSRVLETYPPQYRPSEQTEPLPRLLRDPLGAQEHIIRATAQSLRTNRGTTVVGEMGVGKTYIAIAGAHMAGFQRILILCPPHLVMKWKREIEMTIPVARTVVISSITQLRRLAQVDIQGPIFAITSREQAKLSYLWRPAPVLRPVRTRGGTYLKDPETQEFLTMECCPDCYQQPFEERDEEIIPLTYEDMEDRKRTCNHCGGALWTADNERRRRVALADYIRTRMKGYFDLLIADEMHEYKGRGAAQAIAAGNLAQTCGQSLTLTGTLMGGYASNLFYLLYRFSPAIRDSYLYTDEAKWIDHYGFRERRIRDRRRNARPTDGRGSKKKDYRVKDQEKPGLVPSALLHLLGNTAFLRLSDVATGLPQYEERIITVHLDETPDPGFGTSQFSGYKQLEEDMKKAVGTSISEGTRHMLGKYLQALQSYPDSCIHGETVYDPKMGELVSAIPPIGDQRKYPKEKALAEIVAQEKAEGRRSLVFVNFTNTRDITGRVQEILEEQGVRTAVMKARTPPARDREKWISRQVHLGVEALICGPRLVQTGLDLIDFPTIIWYQNDYSVYTMRQASRRSWRIGQRQPVRVIYMAYENTVQAKALRLIAGKMQASLAVEGELPEEGLAAYSENGDNIIINLAKQIIEEGNREEDSIEEIFAKTKRLETQGEEFITDGDWSLPRAGTPREQEPASHADMLSWKEFMQMAEGPPRKQKPPPQPGMTLLDWADANASP